MNLKIENTIFIIIYISVTFYILIFRVMFDIIRHGEPEYYPLEIITTIAIILTIVLTSLIYYENKESTGERNKLYFSLIMVFIGYFLAENNWLLGREILYGTVIFGILTSIVFLFTLKIIYTIKKTIFLLFLLGIISLIIGTFIDAMHDGHLPFQSIHLKHALFEEVPELFASLFFFHSMFLLYLHLIQEKCSFIVTKNGGIIIVIGAIIIGYGNSFLLEDHGQSIPLIRIVIGIILYFVGIYIPLFFFRYYTNRKIVS